MADGAYILTPRGVTATAENIADLRAVEQLVDVMPAGPTRDRVAGVCRGLREVSGLAPAPAPTDRDPPAGYLACADDLAALRDRFEEGSPERGMLAAGEAVIREMVERLHAPRRRG